MANVHKTKWIKHCDARRENWKPNNNNDSKIEDKYILAGKKRETRKKLTETTQID